MGVVIWCHNISTPLSTAYQLLCLVVWEWQDHDLDIISSLHTIFGEGVIISWHYIHTPNNFWGGGDYTVTLYFHSSRIWHRGWLYLNIFTPHIWLCRVKIPMCFIIYIHIQSIKLTFNLRMLSSLLLKISISIFRMDRFRYCVNTVWDE